MPKEIKTRLPRGSTVLPCRCQHAYQDERYGSGNRVHNQAKESDHVVWRCTVCLNEKR